MSRLQARLSRPFSSFHIRVLAAFVLVIFLALLSAGGGVVWMIQSYRTRLEVDHLSELAVVASFTARQLERQDARPDEIGTFVQGLFGPGQVRDLRILLLDAQGRVVAERSSAAEGSDPAFAGGKLELPPVAVTPAGGEHRPLNPARPAVWLDRGGPLRRPWLFVSAGPPAAPPADARPEAVERFLARQPAYRVVLAVPNQNLASAWRELAPRLGLAAAVALAASVAAAFWLSRSIARPLARITRAAEGIARGDLDQQIPVRGTDEVAHLADAFNIMSREVKQSQQALRDFLANASHELRTPLTSIQGFSQALLDDALPGPEGAKEAGRIINEEAERMRVLVEDLLYLSRVESHHAPAADAPVDVAGLLREASRRLQLTAEQRNLHVAVDLPTLPAVLGVADQLDHLFGNLLDNAGKYTPEGGAITISGRATSDQVVVSVHNTGSYIPAQDLPHVFERFFRVEKSRAREVEGSGLGLAIAHEVAERHGGQITVQSDRARGTTFTVSLPVTRVTLGRRTAERPPAALGGTGAAPATVAV